MKKVFLNNKELLEKLKEAIGSIEDDKNKDIKLNALLTLSTVNRPYDDNSYSKDLIINLYSKKINLILECKNKKEIDEILSIKNFIYNGNEFTPTKYRIVEEELLIWSILSLKAPLNSIGRDRYIEVFKEYYGEKALEIFK